MSEPIFRLPPYWVQEVYVALSQVVDWSHGAIGVPDAWLRSRGEGILVAVLDTGVDVNHSDLAGQIYGAEDHTNSNSGPADKQGHGCWVCGSIVARDNETGVVGIAPGAKVWSGKVLGDGGSGQDNWIAAGIRRAINMDAHIISMSLGSSSPAPRIHEAIKEANAANVLVICAAGNSGPGSTEYPGAYPECVSVGAYDKAGRLAGFSSQNQHVDVAAPGVDMISTIPGNRYSRMSGTSMACPTVAGCAALIQSSRLKANLPLMTPAELLQTIKQTSVDAGKAGFDPGFGWGMVAPEFLIEAGDPLPAPLPVEG